MRNTQIEKLKAELSRRKAELSSCQAAGYSAYNDFLAEKIASMEEELRRAETHSE